MVINEQRSLQDIMARKKILFYGIGNQFKDCFELFRNKENIILFDSNKAGNDCGTYVIHAPEELITYYQEGDAVIISCIKNQYEIAWNLVKKYNIKEDDIFSFTSRVYEERVYLPELIKTNVEKIRFVYNLIEDQESKEYWKNSLLMRMTRQPLQIKNNKNSVVLGEYKDVLELEKQDIIIDCGAYIGDTAKIYNERLQGNCSIYAVEPMKENYEELVKNIKINAWKNVWAYHCAVGSKESRAILRYKKEVCTECISCGVAPTDMSFKFFYNPWFQMMKQTEFLENLCMNKIDNAETELKIMKIIMLLRDAEQQEEKKYYYKKAKDIIDRNNIEISRIIEELKNWAMRPQSICDDFLKYIKQ